MNYEETLKHFKDDLLEEDEKTFVAELNVASCIKHNRENLPLNRLAKVLTEVLEKEEMKSLLRELQKYEI